MEKACNSCGEVKLLDLFPKSKKVKSGRAAVCKVCTNTAHKARASRKPELYATTQRKCSAAYREANKTHIDARVRQWMQDNKAKRQAWRDVNKEQLAQSFRAWRLANPDKMGAKKAARRATIKRAFPLWARGLDFASIYRLRATVTELTGIEHHVDHIVPLKGKTVCGLHVPWNLEVIPAKVNQSKKNKLLPQHAGHG